MPNEITPAVKDRILRISDVTTMTGMSRSTLLRRVKANQFPKHFKLGSGRCVGWLESAIAVWIATQAAQAE